MNSEGFWGRAIKEVLLAAVVGTVFCLLAVALFAVFVRAYAPADTVIVFCNQFIKCAGAFGGAFFFVRAERSLFKGMASGTAMLLLSTVLFGLIGGFRFTPWFALELLLSCVFGALGAVCGGKTRKD